MATQHKHIYLLTLKGGMPILKIYIPKIKKSFFIFYLFLTFLFYSSNSFAQFTYELDKTTRFEKMGAEEGLSSGFVYCIHQDKYGFMWIGTQRGLNLYDGYKVQVFRPDPNNPSSISYNWIDCIFEEADGTMWFHSNIGISKYDRANQTFSNYLPDTIDTYNPARIEMIVLDGDYLWIDDWRNDLLRFNKKTGQFRSFAKDTINPSKGIYNNSTDYIFIDGSGVLWVGTSKVGVKGDFVLNKFNKEDETFIHFLYDPSNLESFAGKKVMSMVEDHDGTIWIATLGGGLLEVIDKEEGVFRHYVHDDNDQNSIIHNYLQKVFVDSKGNIWIGGTKGFSLLNKKTGLFTNYYIPNRTDFPNRSNRINDIYEGANGELYLSAQEGFYRFNPSTKDLVYYIHDPENKTSLCDNWVSQIINDPTGQTWIVAPNSGINRINPFSNAFRRIQKKTNDINSLSSNYISRFYADSKGNFWIGTFRWGLNRTKIDSLKVYDNFEHIVSDADDPKSISGDIIMAIYEDKDQVLWFGTWAGLNKYDYNLGSFTRFQHDPDDNTTISSNSVECIFEDSHGTFWVGTRNGLNIMDKETGKFIRFLPDINDSSSILHYDIRTVFEDSFGELWIGGELVQRLNREDTSFISSIFEPYGIHGIVPKEVWSIIEDDSANLWMTSNQEGLYRFNRNDSTFTTISMLQGLPSNSVPAIEIDDKGFVWVSTSQGLSRIDPHNYSIRNFDMSDGLVSLEFIDRCSHKDKDGWMYFGGRSGFTFFHPDSIKENKVIPPVYITSLNVADEPKYFDKPLYELEEIKLQYSENDFSFDFVALNYINTQKNQYAYMLEGYDEDWNYVGNKRAANYTNMDPGKYTLRVKGSNNDGYWNEEGASLVVVIHPPFWKTWWAYTSYIIFIISLLYLIFRFYLRRLRLLHNLELEQLQSEKFAELDIEKNKFFSNISHEFRTPLTLILGPLEKIIVGKKDGQEKQQLNLVKRNARRLQTLINQLLSLSKLESGKMKLKARPENIVKLIRLFLQSFHSMAEDKGIRLEFESDAEEYVVYVDTIKFEKVVNNLLSNAFKFTEKGGGIKVSFTSSLTPLSPPSRGETHTLSPLEGGLRGVSIKVSDTGIGISKEQLPHVFDRFYQVDEIQMKTNLGTGIGLALTKELIELHHGTITVNSEPGKGSTFTILLPMGKDHLSEDEILVRKDSKGEPDSHESLQEDELLNDDYLFVEDAVTKPEIKTEALYKKDHPLILIVEDNEDMRSYIKSYLAGSYNIIEATNGKEGADQAIEHIPDLIVSDLMMPKLDGNEMTIQLKTDERTSHIPIILLTAKASKESKLEGLETGADDFLTKPFDADELLIRIKNLINQRKRLRKIFSGKLSITVSPNLSDFSDSGIASMDEQFLKKAFETTEKEMSDPEFSVVSFSKQMGLSRMQLHRKLKALTDQSATEFIKIIRLNKAAVLLKSKSATATEIAYDIGFNSPSYFFTCFREHFGKTPSEYTKH